MIILKHENALIDKDLTPAYQAIQTIKDNEITAMFKKKEDINKMSKSVLKHRIQILTKKNIQTIQEEMNYEPVDINEIGINHEILKKLAHCLILLAEGQLQPQERQESTGDVPIQPEPVAARSATGKKRTADVLSPTIDPPSQKKGRRSLASVSQISDAVDSPRGGRGRKSMGAVMMTSQSNNTPTRSSKRSTGTASINGLNDTSTSEASTAVRCMAPVNGENLKNVIEEEESEEEDNGLEGVSNPTPAMKEMMKKRRSVANINKSSSGKRSPVKKITERSDSPAKQAAIAKPAAVAKPEAVAKAAADTSTAVDIPIVKVKKGKGSPIKKKRVTVEPRMEFIGSNNTRAYLIAGDPLQLRMESVAKLIPLSVQFPGAQLAVVHTPHDWSPIILHRMALTIKNLNLSAGLDSFIILAGTGFKNLKMNSEALEQITKHVQFITFHREDANLDEPPNGKLREIATLFLVAYVFPGCDNEGSVLPCQMVNDGYTNCFRCKNVADLEYSILDCFSEKGDWVLDVNCEKRKMTLAAQEQGRNALAITPLKEDLEELGDYLRTQSLKNDDTYTTDDGLVNEL